jgi:hypothetical protein
MVGQSVFQLADGWAVGLVVLRAVVLAAWWVAVTAVQLAGMMAV